LKISIDAMKSDVDELILQGLEFWNTICDTELDIAVNAAEAVELERPAPQEVSRFYAKGALRFVLPIVLEILTKQDEGDDEEAWTPSKCAGVCLGLFAECTEDAIVECVMPFVTQNIADSEWRRREASVMAFGSILQGCEFLSSFFKKPKLNSLPSSCSSK
jgi:importin subunit beta-1